MGNTANRIIKNTGFLYARMGITMFISLYTTRIILDSLGPSDFGIFNIIGGSIAMLGFLNASLASATQRFLSFTEGQGDKIKLKQIFNISIVLHCLLAIIIFICFIIAAYFFFNGILNIPIERYFAAKIIYACLIISTILSIINVPYEAVLNAHENFKFYAIMGVFESILKLLVAICCVYTTSDKLITYGILMMIIPMITLTLIKIYCHKKYHECVISIKKYWNLSIMKEMTTYAGWNLMGTASSMITNNSVSIIMNMFFGTLINAAQGIANQICGLLMTISNTIIKVIHPVITKSSGKGDYKATILLSETSCKVFFSLSAIISIPAIIFMPQLFELWLTDVPQYSVFFARCYLIIALFENMTTGLNSAINAKGEIKDYIKYRSLIKFSFIPISYLLFTLGFSVSCVYFVLIIIQGVINGLITIIYYAKKLLNYSIIHFLKKIFIPCSFVFTCVLCFTFLLKKFLPNSSLTVIIAFISSITLFTMMSFFIILNKRERTIIKDYILSIKTKRF